MERLKRLGLALAVLFLVSSASAQDKCRTGCHGVTPHNFKYAEGTTYKYNLEGNIDISVTSAENQQTSTKLKAVVLLTQLAQCNQVLRVQNLQIIGPDGTKYSNIPDVEKSIKLNFHDGHVEDVICTEAEDTQNSVNIKRAIASLFQYNPKHAHETDVFGLCPTEVASRKEGNVVVVQKSKNLNKCSFRESIKQDFMATAFNLNSEIKSSPILNGQYSCEQRIKNGILEQAVVNENYLYVPFSVGKNGAKAIISTKIQLVGTSKESPTSKANQGRSIIFENPHLVNVGKSNVDDIANALKETAKTIDQTVGDTTAKEFVNFMKILRTSNRNDILAVYREVSAGAGFKDKEAARKIFLDAVIRAGTGDTIEVAIELLRNNKLSKVEQKLVYLGLAFVKHATESSLTAAANLLDQPNLPREAYLGVGTLAGRFCREHSCTNVPNLKQLLAKFVAKLGDGKVRNKEQENEIIAILKAIGNINDLDDSLLAKLTGIAQDKKAPNRVRVAALETFLADPCKDKIRDSALGILKDVQQDSEIRIKAYLVLAQCPNGKVANAIKTLLDSEESYQVGGFIVSHIRNLRASANPDKELAKQQLSLISTTKRFPVDFRKYSHNFEFSYAANSLGLASSVDSNIIYSQTSFVPRATTLNLTVELFGHSFNALSLEARQENFEKLLEHYLGPMGVIRKQTPEELATSGRSAMDNFIKKLKERYETTRTKRDVSKAEIESSGKQVQIKTNELNSDLELDLSVQLFGSELLFLSAVDPVQKFSPEGVIDKIFDSLENCAGKAKNFDEVLRANLLFLDVEFSYPTSLGFPLKVAAEGSSSTQLKASGSVDIFALMSNKRDSALKLTLIPSANIEITGSLSLDAFVVENGLKTISSLYTATGGSVEATYTEAGPKVDIKFTLPVEKQVLISAKHEIVFNTRELGKPEVNHALKFKQNKDFSIYFDQLSPLIGVEFGVDYVGPNVGGTDAPILPFPFSGDVKFQVVIKREDVSMYHYSNVWYLEPKAGKVGTEYVVEVIGKDNKRKVSLEIEGFLHPEAYIKATLNSPVKTAVLEGRLTLNDQEKSILGRFSHDQMEYFGKIGIGITRGGSKSTYKPLLEFRTPSGPQKTPYTVEGAITVDTNGNDVKYTFENVKFIAPNIEDVLVIGYIEKSQGGYGTDLTVKNPNGFVSVKGKIILQPNLLKLSAEMKNSINPAANFNLKCDVKRDGGSGDSSFILIHGEDLSSKQNQLSLTNSYVTRYVNPDDYTWETKNKFSYPLVGLEAKFNQKKVPRSFKCEVDFKYNELKLGSEYELETNKKNKGDYDLEFEIHGLDNKLEIKGKREVTGDKSKIDHSIEVNGKKIELDGTIKHHIKPQDIDCDADLVLKVTGINEPIKTQATFMCNPSDFDSSLKIASTSNVYVDVFLKAQKGGNANGSLKISIKDTIVANGQVKVVKGTGNGNLLVEFPKMKRKVKTETSFVLAEPTYNVVLTFYPDFEKDNSKKIVLSTNNQIKPHNIDSKNFVDFSGQKLEFELRHSLDGKLEDGKLNNEVEVTLPNGCYLSGKFNRNLHVHDGVGNGNVLLILEQRDNKNTPGRKLAIKGVGKDVNMKKAFFDLSYNIVGENGQGKNINIDLDLKRVQQGEQFVIDYNAKAQGSVLKGPLQVTAHAVYKNYVGTYDWTFSHENDGHPCKGNVKYDFDGKGPYTIQSSSEFHVPSANHETVKVDFGGSALLPKGPEDKLDLKGNVGFVANSNKKEGNVNFRGELELNGGARGGHGKSIIQVQNEEPITVVVNYGHSDDKGVKKCNGDVAVQYAANKNIKVDLTYVKLGAKEHKIDLNVNTPHEKAKNVVVQFHSKRSDDDKLSNSEMILTADGKKFALSCELSLSEIAPGVDLQLKYPSGKIDQIKVKVTKFVGKQFAGDLRIEYQEKDFLLEADVDSNLENAADFFVKGSIHSPALKLDKVTFEARNKPAKGGKRIQVNAKSAEKNLLSGSAQYTSRQEGGKHIVEGSGSFKVKDETKSANFKYIRQDLASDKDGEKGLDVSFNAGLGSKAVVAEFKISNKQFRILNSYCEEKKQCAHIEIDSKSTSNDVNEFYHELEIAIDLRKLGLSHEFGLKGVTKRQKFILDHTVDVHFQSQENKYQYSVYVHPDEAGVTLTTPKRIISIEATGKVPNGYAGVTKGEVAIYLNKRAQPQQKTLISAIMDVKGTEKKGSIFAEVKFANPSLGKDLVVNSDLKFDEGSEVDSVDLLVNVDVFARADQKIVITGKSVTKIVKDQSFSVQDSWEVNSRGLNINLKYEELLVFNGIRNVNYDNSLVWNVQGARYDSRITYHQDPKLVTVLVKCFNRELLKIDTKLQWGEGSQTADSTFQIVGAKPTLHHIELKNFNSLTYVLSRKENPNDKLTLNSALILGEIADFRIERIKGGVKDDLIHASVKLDEVNFLKSDYGCNSEIVKQSGGVLKADIESIAKEGQSLFGVFVKEISSQCQTVSEIFMKSCVNLKPLREHYASELEKLRDEILSDKTLKEFGEFLKGIFGVAAQTVSEILSKLSEVTEKLLKTGQASFARVLDILNKDISPKIKEILNGVLQLVSNFVGKSIDVCFAVLGKITEIVDRHQAELKQIATTLSTIGQEVGRFCLKICEQIRAVVSQELKNLVQELKSLPIYDELKHRVENLKEGVSVSEPIISSFKEAAGALRDVIPSNDPNDEIKKFIDVVANYIEKKLRNEKVQDTVELEKIVSSFLKAVQKLLMAVNSASGYEIDKERLDKIFPLSWNYPSEWPRLALIKFSPITYILLGDYPSIKNLLYSATFNPRNWLPPFKLYALAIQGQHIFTFDGKHLTFPGNCNYLLARDAVNGNFTIAGTYTNGILTALTFNDKTDTITLKAGGQLVLNNQAAEFPIRRSLTSAYRLYESMNIVSKTGVQIVCGVDLIGCGFHISGFYHGQLRGLLGNGNYEPFDDFTNPSGKIVTSESDFGNSYKMAPSCAAVKTVDHHAHHHAPACDKLFGSESSLRICYGIVNPENFRTACDHGIASGVKDTEQAIAIAYVAACNFKGIPLHLPSEFIKCENGEKPVDLGEEFSVKTPAKAADIVIIVDQDKSNEAIFKELVQPLITQLTQELQNKHINDVEFHLMGYGGEYIDYPSHLTSAGKFTFKGKAPPLKFSETPKEAPISRGLTKLGQFLNTLDGIRKDINLAIGNHIQARSYSEGLRYPFRAHAVKSLIAVTSNSCETGRFLALQKLRTLLYLNKAIALTLITPFENLKVRDAKHTKSVIGFNSANVFTFADGKKKQGSADLHKELEYEDYCVDFTLRIRGNVFVTNNFVQAKAPAKKQFVSTAAYNIADQLTNVEQGLDCECKLVSPYTAQNVCKVVSSKDKPAPAGRKGGHKG